MSVVLVCTTSRNQARGDDYTDPAGVTLKPCRGADQDPPAFLAAPAPGDELFTGTAFHTWLLRNDGGRLRVAAQIVDGFADHNDSATRLFARPDQGLNR